jgi:hypothetical protein
MFPADVFDSEVIDLHVGKFLVWFYFVGTRVVLDD